MRFSAHLGYLYTEVPLEARIEAAAAAGFQIIEHPEPWALPLAQWQSALRDCDMHYAQVTSGMGTTKGLAAIAGREGDFRRDCLRALDYGLGLGAPYLHLMAGVGGDDRTFRTHIDWTLDRIAGLPIDLLIEPITSIAGYYLNSFDRAVDLAEDYGGAVKILLDSFHAANGGVDAADWVARHGQHLGHIHLADAPHRHEPGSGTLNFAPLLLGLERIGYAGALGLEYIPATSTADSLAFVTRWRAGDFS